MSAFDCKLHADMPTDVTQGELVTVNVRTELPEGATMGYVFLAIPEEGEIFRFAKKSPDEWTLSYQIPGYQPGGVYEVQLYATQDNGVKSEVQYFNVRVHRREQPARK